MERDFVRKAVKYIVGSTYKENIVRTLLGNREGMSAGDLYKRSGCHSEGSFYWHVKELQWLDVLTDSNPYKLTEQGEELTTLLEKHFL